jgi:uncharacterized protein involved in response to NO
MPRHPVVWRHLTSINAGVCRGFHSAGMSAPELFQLDPAPTTSPPYPIVLAKGFRIFFLAAGLAGAGLMAVWLALLFGFLPTPQLPGGPAWHGHEMVFGFAFAVVSGFLLTAVYNWVGRPHLCGWRLGGLVFLWLMGRGAMAAYSLLPPWLAALCDLSFLPVLVLVLTPPLLRARKWENVGFMGLLLLAALDNAAFHLDALGVADLGGTTRILTGAVEILVVFVAILSGRIMVMFTENGVRGLKTRSFKWVERLVLPVTLLFVLADLLPIDMAGGRVAAACAFAATLVHGVRLVGWQSHRTLKVPLVWVLHLGYLGLIAALLLKGLANLGLAPATAALHGFTVAALGPVTLGMMARIGLGHTGRLIRAPALMPLAFALIWLAGIVRIAAALSDQLHDALLLAAGVGWTLAFVLFLIRYLPILTQPRVDGQPG